MVQSPSWEASWFAASQEIGLLITRQKLKKLGHISQAWFQSLASQRYFSFPLPVSFQQSSKTFIHRQLTLYNVTNWVFLNHTLKKFLMVNYVNLIWPKIITHRHTSSRGKINKLCGQQLCSAPIQFSGTFNYQRREPYNRIFTVALTQLHSAFDAHVTVYRDKTLMWPCIVIRRSRDRVSWKISYKRTNQMHSSVALVRERTILTERPPPVS